MLARVSEVESYRRWRLDEELDLAWLLARLRGDEQPSARMLAGTAFHAALEHAGDGEHAALQANGHVFHFADSVELELPRIRELRANRFYEVDGGALEVSGCVDCLLARRIDDHKTTQQMDAEGYAAGYQWRFYLDIFGADTFRWNVFEVREIYDREFAALPAELRTLGAVHYMVVNAHRLEQHRYPGMSEDCARLAAEFYRFARVHLPERFATAEAA